jgi:hypothetical protein
LSVTSQFVAETFFSYSAIFCFYPGPLEFLPFCREIPVLSKKISGNHPGGFPLCLNVSSVLCRYF